MNASPTPTLIGANFARYSALWFGPFTEAVYAEMDCFNAHLRDELLNGEIFYTLREAQIVILPRNHGPQRLRSALPDRVWIRTGFGRHRPVLVCSSCGGGAIRLFGHYGNYACRFCHRALYASQKYDQNGRKRLKASKLRLDLGGLPDINEPFPPKPKWTRRRTYQRIRNKIQALEATAKQTRFRKPLSTRLFAYHVG